MNRKQWLLIKLILLILMFITLLGISVRLIRGFQWKTNIFKTKMIGNTETGNGDKQSFPDVSKIDIESISLTIVIYESDVAEVTIQDNSTGYGNKNKNKIFYKDETLFFKQGKQNSFLSSIKGNVVVEVPRGSILEYDIGSISGSIYHDALSKENIRVNTVSGSIKISQAGERVFAESISGSIKMVANENSKEISASSVSGSIKIQLDKVQGYEMYYSTVAGSIKDTYSEIDYSKSGKAINGDESLKIRTDSVSGSIELIDW